MAKKYNKKSTLMARMGFRDPDLKLESHDDIIIWLYEKETITEIVKEYILPEVLSKSLENLKLIFNINRKR